MKTPERSTRSSRRFERGFSLIELVISVGILTIIMGVAFSIMNGSQVSFDRNQLLSEAHQNADFASTRLAEIIRGAGSNPENDATINSLRFISNRLTDNGTDDPTVVRLRSDLNGDRTLDDRVDPGATGAGYFILVSEDVVLRFHPEATTINGVALPRRSISLTDLTPGPLQGQPLVIAEHIIDFSCPVTANPTEVTLTLEAGPSRNISETDPRYVSFTRVMHIRLRNRN